MTNLTTFNYLSKEVRVQQIDGQPWFVAMDVCRVLGFHTKADGTVNVTNATYWMNVDETTTAKISDGRTGKAKLISEGGLYKLIMRSDKPEARQFQDWVTREVLPSIRKDGAYIKGEELVKTGELDEDYPDSFSGYLETTSR